MAFNPWHDVEVGDGYPEIVNAIIEIPKNSKAKYEIDKRYGMLKLDRVLYSSFFYPANYGFIPQTLGDDKDPLDIVVVSQVEVEPLCIVRAQVIGVMRMVDRGAGDDKIIAVAADDKSVNHITEIGDLPEHFYSELRHFFEEYTKLENKTVRIDALQDKAMAIEIMNKSIEDYKAMRTEP